MLKDRGNIKWTAMMIPEHVSRLRKVAEELTTVKKPIVDIQQLEEFEYFICEAMEHNHVLTFVYWDDGKYGIVLGKVHYIDSVNKQLRVVDQFDERHYIPIAHLVDVR
ncbi:YolD-like family protein [Alkalihalobacterium bogoriense]|uniref:YolD-like family protein n=1 Tax=Alkalihalobacterium bogoriense TaxID=246272 RepID=UPI00047E69BD|nr:YolD-like family protein [Alkalihalobacterium bogoriense]